MITAAMGAAEPRTATDMRVGPNDWSVLTLIAVCVWGLGACGARSRGPSITPFDAEDRAYGRVYAKWTRETDNFSVGALTNALMVSATLESVEFREAYHRLLARDLGLPVDEAAAEFAKAREACKSEVSFVVTLTGRRFREANLAGRQSAWNLWLVVGEGLYRPVSLVRYRKPNPQQQKMFPSISRLREAFRVVFERPPELGEETPLRLRFTGPYGRTDLLWHRGLSGRPLEDYDAGPYEEIQPPGMAKGDVRRASP